MKVTLINPPRFAASANPFISGGYYKNLGLLYLAAALEQRNINVNFIDALNEGVHNNVSVTVGNQRIYRHGLSYQEICSRIDNDTSFIGVSIPFSNSALIVDELSKVVKEIFPQIPLAVGGVHASTLPRQALTEAVDYVIIGEGEEVFADLVEGVPKSQLSGLLYREEGRIIDSGRAPYINDLDKLSIPAYHVLGSCLDTVLSWSGRGEKNQRTISLITSRGCPFDCEFCSVHPVLGYKWRARSPENVLDEIAFLQEKYNINHREFEDDNLTYIPQRAEEIFAGMLAMKKDITWSAHNGVRIDKLTYNLLKLMKKSGCLRLNLAIESGSEKTLKLMNKKLSLEKVEEVIAMCAELNIPTSGFMLIGYPGESEDDFRTSLSFFRRQLKRGLGSISPLIVNPYSGTKLFERCKRNNYLKDDAASHIYTIDDSYVAINTPQFSEQDVLRWQEEAVNLHKPLRRKLKMMLKYLCGDRVYQKIIQKYRKVRDFS